MAEIKVNQQALKTMTIGEHDAIVGDDLIKGIQTKLVFIPTSVDPSSNAPVALDGYQPGTFAIAYGGGAVYQKDDSGAWVVFGSGGGD